MSDDEEMCLIPLKGYEPIFSTGSLEPVNYFLSNRSNRNFSLCYDPKNMQVNLCMKRSEVLHALGLEVRSEKTCPYCGFVMDGKLTKCTNCGGRL